MSVPIRMEVPFDRRLFRRALMAWWQSVIPPAPYASRLVRWMVIWAAILGVVMVLGAYGISPTYAGAALIGAGVLVAAFVFLQSTRMRRFSFEISRHWDAAGVAEAVFDEAGLVMEDRVSRLELQWPGIEAVRAVRGGTVIRAGMRMIAIPDTALPSGLGGKAFRAQLNTWRRAAHPAGGVAE